MSGWFWSSAFGPLPFAGASASRTKGSAAGGDAGRDEGARVAAPCGVRRSPGTPERQEEGGAQCGRAEVAGAHGNDVRCAGVAPADGAVYTSSCFAMTCVAMNVASAANEPSTTT